LKGLEMSFIGPDFIAAPGPMEAARRADRRRGHGARVQQPRSRAAARSARNKYSTAFDSEIAMQ
jgi:hypothetical protein